MVSRAEREGLKKRIVEMRELLNSQETEVLEYDERFGVQIKNGSGCRVIGVLASYEFR